MPVEPNKPDPTERTIEALRHEIELLREEIDRRGDADAKLLDEKMSYVKDMFMMIEDRRKEAKDDSRKEVDAALEAQQEAANKSEASFKEQLDGLKTALARVEENLRRDIEETKKRVTSVE